MHYSLKQFISAMFVLATVAVHAQKKNLQLDNIYGQSRIAADSVLGFRSMNDGMHYTNTINVGGATVILKYDFATGHVTDTVLNGRFLVHEGKKTEFSNYQFSSDERLLLLTTDEERLYRHSTKASFFIYDRSSQKLRPLSNGGKQMYAAFSPDGKNVAFVRDNNIYITKLSDFTERQVTADGERNKIINGATDWVYEEEFSMDVAYAWNADGSALAFYRFDESAVKEFNLTFYDSLYPREEKYKYPKAGEENSKVEIYVYHLGSGKTIRMDTGTEREYIPRIKWTSSPAKLSVQRTNRHQNKLELLICDAATGNSSVLLTEENNSFIEITNDLQFLSNGRQFIWSSSRSGFNHIYLYNMDGSLARQITSGNFDVMNYYGYNESTKQYFYQSAEPTPTERRINCITSSGRKQVLSPAAGTNVASFGKSFRFFVNIWSAYGQPYRCTLRDISGKEIRMLKDNDAAYRALNGYNIAPVETLKVKNDAGTEINGWMIRPQQFKSDKKYPVLFFVYGGPGKQTVSNAWGGNDYLWHQILAQNGYIIVSFDNRGTKGRGIDFSNAIYKKMGELEVEDQLSMVRHIKSLPYVDTSRIGVWGWSYGGYMTSLMLTKGNGVFKCGIAVAPVTNWRFYDSIYTERYLQTPQENPDGYDLNSPINFAASLKGKFLLVHGSADDNVHMQNTMEFATALVNARIPFDMFIYPDKSHGITGLATRYHLYNKMTDFIISNL